MIDTLETAREALARHAWNEALEGFMAADRDGELSPADLELMGMAAWWSGRPDESTDALERAYANHVKAGRNTDAARVALELTYRAFQRLAAPVGAGWLARAERLLEGEPESEIQAALLDYQALGALVASRYSDVIALAERAMGMARRQASPDALFMGMTLKGVALLATGDWQDGLALIDEAAAAAASGQLDLRIASDIFCHTMSACRDIGDLERAGQWADESERWMRRQSVGGYPGVCRIHRAELKMLHGRWSEAEQDARQACEELERFRLLIGIGFANDFIGEVRLRMGDLEGAAEAFERAYEYGHDAQPGLTFLHLARGEVAEARRSIDRALAATAGSDGQADRVSRARLLPASVEVSLAEGDLASAGRTVEELEAIARDFERPLFEAGALGARGDLLLHEDKPAEAEPLLGRSWRLWQQTDLPYEAARARLRYAEALAAEGDLAAAGRDLRAARAAFERLGAKRDLERVDAILGQDAGPSSPSVRRETKTFMFTDIVTSTDLIGLIGDDAWSELLRWHDRELRAAFATHHGQEVNHTGDGFFVAFDRAVDALEGAVDIQRRLARHRRDHGFAPWVRIGLHATEAMLEGRSYSGHGVHVAARVGAAASGEEILVTDAVRDAAASTRFSLSEPRTLTLKGVKDPVEVRSVAWR